MAIAHDSSAGNFESSGSPASLSWSHTCTGSDLVLFVYAFNDDGSDKVTGITYNSVAMTRVAVQSLASAQTIYLYSLINPATGSNTVVVSASSGSNQLGGSSLSYTGGNQTTQPDSSNTSTENDTTSYTLNTTVVASDAWTIGGSRNNAEVPTFDDTQRDTSRGTMVVGDSNATVGTGSQGHTWSGADSGADYAGIVASINPVAVAATDHGLSWANF